MEEEETEKELPEDFEHCLELTSEAIARYAAEQTSSMKVPLPPKAHQEKLQEELQKGLLEVFKKLRTGFLRLLEYLVELSVQQPTQETQYVLQQLTQMTAIASVLAERVNDYMKLLENKLTMQEIFGLDEKGIHGLYTAAKYIYEQQNYKEAASAFAVLAIISPSQHTFWVGLGNCEYFCHNFEGALLAYSMAARVDPLDPTPHFFSAKCYEATKEIPLAMNALDLALVAIGDSPDHASWKTRLEQEKIRLRQKR